MSTLAAIPDDFGNWLAGFIDGEGSFNIRRQPGRMAWYCTFDLALRDDDAAIVRDIHARLGFGRVVAKPALQASRPLAIWKICNRADCLLLVEVLDRYPLRAKKARDYATWREAVFLWTHIRNGVAGHNATLCNGPTWTKIADLATELRETRHYQEEPTTRRAAA